MTFVCYLFEPPWTQDRLVAMFIRTGTSLFYDDQLSYTGPPKPLVMRTVIYDSLYWTKGFLTRC